MNKVVYIFFASNAPRKFWAWAKHSCHHMCPNIWNAHRTQSEFLKCNSKNISKNIQWIFIPTAICLILTLIRVLVTFDVHCCRHIEEQTSKMQPSGLPVYCSPQSEQRANFSDAVSCASVNAGRSTDHHHGGGGGYPTRRLDCAGDGSDVTPSRGRRSSSSSSQSVEDVNVARTSSLHSTNVSPNYVDHTGTATEYDHAPASDLTPRHNGYRTINFFNRMLIAVLTHIVLW